MLAESGARQNYNLGDVIPAGRNGLHIPRLPSDGGSGTENLAAITVSLARHRLSERLQHLGPKLKPPVSEDYDSLYATHTRGHVRKVRSKTVGRRVRCPRDNAS
ncbi:hypothetical protein HZH66_013762 [Vespula vulgaris]|uniref:Uncharacterized protein n=1 Tax=Vespula vulgaris TaxID=7454 RepID=A0A834J4B9_VESVU|nr:hypothetical protein HZH66_013762 [Vespula vulgaris]